MKRLALDTNDLVRRYLAGESENAIAKNLGVGRRAIRLRLLENGIEPRGSGEANLLLAKSRTPEERHRLASFAFNARRGMKDSDDIRRKRARSRETMTCFIGNGERELLGWLSDRGLDCTAQTAVEGYNIDIACPPVAVELYSSPVHPFSVPKIRKRVKKLLDLDWAVLYIWAWPIEILSEAVADQVVTFIEETRSSPASPRQYGVIWGSADRVATGGYNLDELAVIPAAIAALDVSR